jgi:hypothetical protein
MAIWCISASPLSTLPRAPNCDAPVWRRAPTAVVRCCTMHSAQPDVPRARSACAHTACAAVMGNDMRNVSDASKAILFNKHAIAVSQDPAGKMGIRISGEADLARPTSGMDPPSLLHTCTAPTRSAPSASHAAGDVAQQLWVRELAPSPSGKSRAAVGLYNKGGSPPTPPMPPAGHCPDWTHTAGGGDARDHRTATSHPPSEAMSHVKPSLQRRRM